MTAPNPAAAFPALPVEGRYRMGPSFTETPGRDWWWNLQDPADGAYTICDGPTGWESPPFLTPQDQVGGRDGALTGPTSYGPRVLEVSGAVVSPDRVTSARRKRALLAALMNGRVPFVWEQHDLGLGYRLAVVVRVFGQPLIQDVSATALRVEFTMVTDDAPWRYRSGAGESAEIGLADPSVALGRTYSKTYPYTYGAGVTPGGQVTVVNTGDMNAWPVFTITGPVEVPVIRNGTTGAEFAVAGNILAGQTVRVDARTGVIVPQSTRLLGVPWPLVPGPNTITWRATTGVYNPAARLRLDWRSTSS